MNIIHNIHGRAGTTALLHRPLQSLFFSVFIISPLAILATENRRAVVIATQLRVRSQPALQSDVIYHLKKGEFVTLLNKSTFTIQVDNNEEPWYEIAVSSGTKGWVFGGYLDFSEELQKNSEAQQIPVGALEGLAQRWISMDYRERMVAEKEMQTLSSIHREKLAQLLAEVILPQVHDSQVIGNIYEALIRLGSFAAPVVPILLARLETEMEGGRYYLPQIFVHFPSKALPAMPHMIQLFQNYRLDDDSSGEAIQIAGNIAQIAQAEDLAYKMLLDAMRDPDDNVRAMVVYTLGLVGPGKYETLVFLENGLSDKSYSVQANSVAGLKHLAYKGEEKALEILQYWLKDGQNSSLQIDISEALAEIGKAGPEVLSILTKTASGKNHILRARAAGILGHFSGQPKAIMPFLKKLLADDYWQARKNAIETLSRVNTDEAKKLIEKYRNGKIHIPIGPGNGGWTNIESVAREPRTGSLKKIVIKLKPDHGSEILVENPDGRTFALLRNSERADCKPLMSWEEFQTATIVTLDIENLTACAYKFGAEPEKVFGQPGVYLIRIGGGFFTCGGDGGEIINVVIPSQAK